MDLEAGLAPPVFGEIAARFRVTIFTERIGPTVLDDTDQTTPRATRTRLARLVGSGLLREIGTGPQDPKRRYFRTE